MAGKALTGRYQVSRVDDDAWEAVAIYDRLASELPASSYADDALLLAGQLLEKPLKSPEEAWLRYQRITQQFPAGDAAGMARTRLVALDRYAPQPPVPPPLPPPAAVTVAPLPASSPAAPVAMTSATSPGVAAVGAEAHLAGIRFWSNPGYTRVVIDFTAPVPYATNFLNARSGGKPAAAALSRFQPGELFLLDVQLATPALDPHRPLFDDGSLAARGPWRPPLQRLATLLADPAEATRTRPGRRSPWWLSASPPRVCPGR